MSDRETVWTREDVTELLDHDDAHVRSWAIRWLRIHVGGEEAGERAAGMLVDPEPRVVEASVAVLRETGAAGHREELEACLERDDLSDQARGHLLILLASVGEEDAREALAGAVARATDLDWSIWSEHAPESFAEFLFGFCKEGEFPGEPDLLEAGIQTQDVRLAAPALSAILRIDEAEAAGFGPEDDERTRLLDDLLFHASGALPARLQAEDIQWQAEADEPGAPRRLPFPVDDGLMREFGKRLREHLEADDAVGFANCVTEFAEVLVDEGLVDDEPAAENREGAWAMALARALPEVADAFETPELLLRVAYGIHLGLSQSVGIQRALETWEGFDDLLELHVRSFGRKRERVEEVIAARWNDAPADSEERDRWGEEIRVWLRAPQHPEEGLVRLALAAGLEGLVLEEPLAEFVDRIRSSEVDLQALGPDSVSTFAEVLLEQRNWFAEHARELIAAGGGLSNAAQFALGKSNASWAAGVLRDEMEGILREDIGGDIWRDVRRLGDPALLDLVVDEWHPHQIQLTRAAHLLAHLDGRPEAIPDAVATEVEALERPEGGGSVLDFFNRLRRGEDVLQSGPLVLLLRCHDCRRCYRYEFDRVLLDPQKIQANPESVFESAEFTPSPECWHCGGSDFSPTRVTAVILMLGLQEILDGEVTESSLFQLKRSESADSQPTPGRQGSPGGRLSRSSSAPEKSQTTYVAGEEPGRNDPCPCGSGRKYKKCCLRK